MRWPTLSEIEQASKQLSDYIVETPVSPMTSLPNLKVKREHLQKGGSFKIRGALLQALQLKTQYKNPILITASGGNHGVAVSLAGQLLTLPSIVFLDKNASLHRVDLCRQYGSTVHICESRDQAMISAKNFSKSEHLPMIHPFDHMGSVLGSGTVGLELLDELKTVDTLIVPVGGGGLIAGISLVAKSKFPNCKIIGVQASACDAMLRSFHSGQIEENHNFSKLAYSLCPPYVGQFGLAAATQFVDRIVTVTDEEIAAAMLAVRSDFNALVEGAGCASIAAYQKLTQGGDSLGKVLAIISGSNVSEEEFP